MMTRLVSSRLRRHSARISLWLLIALCFTGEMASGAPLTAPEQTKMQGSWIVSASGTNRLYEFSPGLNVKISGDALKDRRGHLTQLSDGAFLIKLDGDEVLRFTYAPTTDQLTVEFFKNKKDMEKGLPAHWKTVAQRRP